MDWEVGRNKVTAMLILLSSAIHPPEFLLLRPVNKTSCIYNYNSVRGNRNTREPPKALVIWAVSTTEF